MISILRDWDGNANYTMGRTTSPISKTASAAARRHLLGTRQQRRSRLSSRCGRWELCKKTLLCLRHVSKANCPAPVTYWEEPGSNQGQTSHLQSKILQFLSFRLTFTSQPQPPQRVVVPPADWHAEEMEGMFPKCPARAMGSTACEVRQDLGIYRWIISTIVICSNHKRHLMACTRWKFGDWVWITVHMMAYKTYFWLIFYELWLSEMYVTGILIGICMWLGVDA